MTNPVSITSFTTDAMKKFMGRMASHAYDPLTADEQCRLARRMAHGDNEARNILIKANMRIVICVAKKYQGLGFTLDDLVGYGFEGLVKACDHYNCELGKSFVGYAVYWVRETIMSGINRDGCMRMPRRYGNLRSKARKEMARYEALCGERMDEADLAVLLDVRQQDLYRALHENVGWNSLDVPKGDTEDSMAWVDMLEAIDDNETDMRAMATTERALVDGLITKTLSERDAQLFVAYATNGERSLSALASEHDMTVDQLKTKLANCRRRLQSAA